MDPFDVDLSVLDLEYGAECGAPPLAAHSVGSFCDPHDLHALSPADHQELALMASPAGSSPEHSPQRPKQFKRRRSITLEARKRALPTPQPQPESGAVDERIEIARGALYNLYGTIQSERAHTFRALTLLATENRRLAMHADNMAMHNSQLAKHVLELARIVHVNALQPPVAAPTPLPPSPTLECSEQMPRSIRKRK